MLWFYRFLVGYLRVIFYGEAYEKILNLTAYNRITLWNSQLVKGGLESNITVKDFRALKEIIRGKGIRVHILKKIGVPFWIQKNRIHSGLLIGFAIFIAFLEFMAGFIWIIDVEGNSKVATEEILTLCESVDIRRGVMSDSINPKNRREKLLLKTDKLAWVSLNVEGSRLTVNVSETKNAEKEELPCNLVATADGIVKKIDVKSGNCLVKVGDTVKKGDVLVSGIIERADSTQFVVSQGEIIADTKTEIAIDGEYVKIVNRENGEKIKKSVLEIFSLKLPLFLGSETKEYNSTLNSKNIRLFGSDLPIIIHTREFRFTESQEICLSRDELTEELIGKIKQQMGTEKFKIENEEFTETANGLLFRALISAEQNIVKKELLHITNDA